MKAITNNILKAAKIAATSNVRPVLASVYVSETEIKATDSYKMLVIDRTKEDSSDIEEFPTCDNVQKVEKLEAPVLIPAKQLLKKQKFPKNMALPVLEQGILSNQSGGKISVTTTDLDTFDTITYQTTEGEYPKTDSIIPDKEQAKAKIHLNAKLLIELLQAFTDHDGMTLYLFDEKTPALIEQKEKTGVIMPRKESTY